MRSAVLRLGRWASRPGLELRSIASRAAAGWRSGRRPWLGAGLAVATVVCDLLLHVPRTAGAVRACSALRADLPIGLWLARAPGSALVPTPDLPLWLAAAQLAVVVGLAELLFARRTVVLVAALGHLLPTLAARVMIGLGPANALGLPHYLGSELDTGPSALTTAVGGYLLLRCGGRRLVVLLGAALLLAERLSPGLDGREHLLALLVGAAAAGVAAAAAPGQRDRRDASPPAVPVLRPRWALGALGAVLVGLLVVSGYHPVQVRPLVSAAGTRAVELQDRGHLPVDLTALPAGTWMATSAACAPPGPATRSDGPRSVWHAPRFLCSRTALGAPVVLRYRVAGVAETQRLRSV